MTPLIVYVVSGTAFKPGSLVPDYARRADYVSEDSMNGDACGVVFAHGMEARLILERVQGITVGPPHIRALTAAQVARWSYAGAQVGDTGYDLALRLFAHHGMPWFHPEFRA